MLLPVVKAREMGLASNLRVDEEVMRSAQEGQSARVEGSRVGGGPDGGVKRGGGRLEETRGRTCLSCSSALLRTLASASRVATMQLLIAAASILVTWRGP